jgi:hypothetical protein
MEVLVALAIGGAVLAGARALLDGIADAASAMARHAHDADATANAERSARQVVGNLALADGLRADLMGTPTQAVFSSWCPAPRGGLEACHARLVVEPSQDGSNRCVMLELSTSGSVSIACGARASLRYLEDSASGGRWVSQWSAPVSLPYAIGVATDTSTLLLGIGDRR